MPQVMTPIQPQGVTELGFRKNGSERKLYLLIVLERRTYLRIRLELVSGLDL